MDKFKAMQIFVQIADQGSLTAAARSLDISLPAVVRTLAVFEADLGARLFNRTTRRVSLTNEGRHHLETCRQILTMLNDAEAALADSSDSTAELRGQLTVTAPVQFGTMHVAPAITRFVQRHAHVQVGLQLYDRVVNLLEEGIDVGVRLGPMEDSSLIAQNMGHIRRVVVASPDYLQRMGTVQHPQELERANCVRRTGVNSQWGPFVDEGRKFNITVGGNLAFNQIAPAVQACVAGIGYGMFMRYQVAPYLLQNQLQIVLEDFEAPPRALSVVYPHARLLPARTRAFIDWIREELKGFRES